MKLRLSSSNIRIRLQADEVSDLESGKEVLFSLALMPEQLSVRLFTARQGPMIQAQQGEWRVILPVEWVQGWMASERVGFDTQVKTADGRDFRLVVEKDFPCRHDASEAPAIPRSDRMDASDVGLNETSSPSVT